jgi:hypothetical protein
MINWIGINRFPFDRINDNVPGQAEKYGSNAREGLCTPLVLTTNKSESSGWDDIYRRSMFDRGEL